jgi:hypothetical protein
MALIKCKECGKKISNTAKTCPNCGAKNKKKGLGIGGILLLSIVTFFLLVIICSQISSNSGGRQTSSRLSENSAEYKQQVYDHMKVVVDDPDIDGIYTNGSLLYINFIKPQSKSEYQLVAKTNAVKFSKFKLSKLGVSGVTVFCTYNGNVHAQSSARKGVVTSSK